MPIINRIADFQAEMTEWRHRLHAHPETAFEEHETSEFVAERLTSFGVSVERGIAGTGVVGTLRGSVPGRARLRFAPIWMHCPSPSRMGLRMHRNIMGACMPAGMTGTPQCCLVQPSTSRKPATSPAPIHFIFQPAEENEGGARAMIEEGVLERYPVEGVFGMHNWPEYSAGRSLRNPTRGDDGGFRYLRDHNQGPCGGHAAMPHLAVDPIVAAAQVINALQTIASRNTHPLESAVVSIT